MAVAGIIYLGRKYSKYQAEKRDGLSFTNHMGYLADTRQLNKDISSWAIET